MKKYKVNGKIVVADSLRDAIVKYRKFNDAFVLKHFSGKYLSESGDFVYDIENARKFSTENEARTKANAMSSEDDTFTVVSVKDAQTFSVNQKYHDPKGRIWEIKSIDGDLLTIAVDGKEMSNKLHKEIFAEWAKTWDVEDAKDATDPQKEKGRKNAISKMANLLQKATSLNNSGKWSNLRDVLDDAVELHEDAYYREGYFYDSADSVKDYDDEYFSVRYSKDGKDGIFASRILIKANSEAEAREKFENEMKGYKIASISQGVPEGAESLIRRGISVIK